MTIQNVMFTCIALGCLLSVAMTIAWLVQRVTRNSGWIDTIWSLSVGMAGASAALWPMDGSVAWRRYMVAALIAIWAARLSMHIAARSRGIADDPRYAAMIREWGESAPSRLWLLLQAQAAVGLVLALAVALAARHPEPGLRLQDILGVAVLLAAVYGEALADWQLRQFTRDKGKREKVCDVGLWRISRHPNYFFEWLGWVAYAIMAIELSNRNFASWLAIAAPATMYYILRHVSGVPPLEAHMIRTKGDAYIAYQRRTPVFFPFFPGQPRATP